MKRKHWSEYPIGETGYGNHKYGFGVYHVDGLDYWIDWECATKEEIKKYRYYLKSNGWKEKRGAL